MRARQEHDAGRDLFRRAITLQRVLAAAAAVSFTQTGIAQAQVATNVPAPVPGAKAVTLKWLKVHSPAIAGNLEGDSPDRDVLVVLPRDERLGPQRSLDAENRRFTHAGNQRRRIPLVRLLKAMRRKLQGNGERFSRRRFTIFRYDSFYPQGRLIRRSKFRLIFLG